MSYCTMIDLVLGALPKSFDPESLKQYGPKGWWEEKPQLALAYALRKHPAIDWDAYLEYYADIKESGLDPVNHFLKDGVYEGRLLFLKEKVAVEPDMADRPKISIIMPNFNNALYIGKAISSLLNQTLQDIEILIVDDASTDNSLQIAKRFAEKDKRVKILKLEKQGSQHMVRKVGVAASNGQYIMFLDSDDYYVPTACEIAYNKIIQGYDIVAFNTTALTPPYIDPEIDARWSNNYLNRGNAGEIIGDDIMKAIFVDHTYPELLSDKIYNGPFCREAFASMEEGFWPRGPDIYQSIVLSAKATKVAKIDNYLYVYRTRLGISHPDASDYMVAQFALTGDLIGPIKRFLEASGNMKYYPQIKADNMGKPLHAWLDQIPARHVTSFFNTMAKQYGVVYFIQGLCNEGESAWLQAANKFQHYDIGEKKTEKPKTIGILYGILGNGGAERVVRELAKKLVARGFRLVVFLEEEHENDADIPEDAAVVYIGKLTPDKKTLTPHLAALDNALKQYPVDLMLCHNFYNRAMLWQIMLIRYHKIPAIIFPHGAFFSRLLCPGDDFDLDSRCALLRCADKTSVLSIYDEIFYREHEVDAQYIPNPVRLPEPDWHPVEDFGQRRNKILVFSRFGDRTKNVNDCLYVLRELVKKRPEIKMTFVGSFVNGQFKPEFDYLVNHFHLKDNVEMTGWLNDARPYIDKAGVLLSCAYHEAFPLSISEAQGRGLPCVMYDLPIMVARDNPSIIQVEHGDFISAARAILSLLDDRERWSQLSNFAMQYARQFSDEAYLNNIENLINNYSKLTPITFHNSRDYQRTIKSLAFYGAHIPPWHK